MAVQVLAEWETWQQLVLSNPISLLVGIGIGFVVSNRWKIIRRNGKPDG
jgi:hypothetical protein